MEHLLQNQMQDQCQFTIEFQTKSNIQFVRSKHCFSPFLSTFQTKFEKIFVSQGTKIKAFELTSTKCYADSRARTGSVSDDLIRQIKEAPISSVLGILSHFKDVAAASKLSVLSIAIAHPHSMSVIAKNFLSVLPVMLGRFHYFCTKV